MHSLKHGPKRITVGSPHSSMSDRLAEGPLAAFTPSALGFMQLPHPLVLAPWSSCAVFGQGKLNWDPPKPPAGRSSLLHRPAGSNPELPRCRRQQGAGGKLGVTQFFPGNLVNVTLSRSRPYCSGSYFSSVHGRR